MTNKEYVDKGGVICPSCGSHNISADEFDPESCSVSVECSDCGSQWNDVYKLTGFSDLRKDEDQDEDEDEDEEDLD